MPHISTLKQSKYLARGDVAKPILVTINSIQEENLALEDQKPEMRHVLHFAEAVKPMVLNWTNLQLIAQAVKSETTEEWIGKQVVLYDDPNVTYMGKVTGGIRARAPKVKAGAAPAKPAAPVAPVEEEDSDVGF